MKLSDNTNILSTKIVQKKSFSVVKNYFKILDLERYLQNKRYLLSGECIYSDSILIIISSENEGYKKYLGTLEYESSIDTIIDVLKDVLIRNEKVPYVEYYFIIDKQDFLKNESLLYELFVMFNFSLIIGLKEKLTKNDLRIKLSKFSFYSVFNLKRWSGISNWQLFLDINHDCGILKYKSQS
ncbi:hypothetical protein [Flavobacterium hydrophilum]|uniref:Uncharacterized protein n=1 Tax=Flavobacterium hydrophilum TaxID=2211445 RepID=A0A2V4BX72_9FLAO|nr:hypothetical protein [Flavobacterium hydrophilum]PXY43605.1 hypothetical protein DMB68_18640 [Flavobacterium hydrophilum]